jgi:hypothetical protein
LQPVFCTRPCDLGFCLHFWAISKIVSEPLQTLIEVEICLQRSELRKTANNFLGACGEIRVGSSPSVRILLRFSGYASERGVPQ